MGRCLLIQRRYSIAWYIIFLHVHAMQAAVEKMSADTAAKDLATTLAHAMRIAAEGESFRQLDLNCVPWCVEKAVELMNEYATPNLGTLFTMTYITENEPTETRRFFTYYINISCRCSSVDPRGIDQASSVVSSLKVDFKEISDSNRGELSPHTKLGVIMISGATVLCVQRMHLATLLRTCALLCAQLLGYVGTPKDIVYFTGTAVSLGTFRIYKKLVSNLETTVTLEPPKLNEWHEGDMFDFYTYLRNPGLQVPPSARNISVLIAQCQRDSGDMCREPFPQQIKHRKRRATEQPTNQHGQASACRPCGLCVRQHTYSPIFYIPVHSQATPVATQAYLWPRQHPRFVSSAPCLDLKPVYFDLKPVYFE